MERVESLIHKIKEQYEQGTPKATLLVTLDELRSELMLSINTPEPVQHRVSVWLPAGYAPQSSASSNGSHKDAVVAEISEPIKPKVQLKVPADALIYQTQVAEDEVLPTERAMPDVKPIYTAPKPPVVAIMEEMPELEPSLPAIEPATNNDVVIEKTAKETTFDEMQAVPEVAQPIMLEAKETTTLPEVEELEDQSIAAISFDTIEPKGQETPMEAKPLIFQFGTDFKQDTDLETELEEPVVFELNESEPWQPITLPKPPEKSVIPEGFLQPSTLLKEPGAKPRELHEILATRVVAQEGTTERKPKVISEALGGSKIVDIRKAISINDRFRYINSLFRGDENLFERTLKTINNFGILQEAQYWIQRELVIKYGWNDEDELVQQFYSLVSRRFL